MFRTAALALVLLGGCDDHLFPTDEGFDTSDPVTADWDGVKRVFDTSCIESCHETLAPVLPDAIEADLASGAGEYVVAGDPAASLLWQAVDQTGSATPMPLGQPRLPDSAVDPIREWIANGAEL